MGKYDVRAEWRRAIKLAQKICDGKDGPDDSITLSEILVDMKGRGYAAPELSVKKMKRKTLLEEEGLPPERTRYYRKGKERPLKGFAPREGAPLGLCTECKKPAFTQWFESNNKGRRRIAHQLCKKHDDAMIAENRAQRKRLGLA